MIVVGFLDEEAYSGPLSKNLLLASSEKVVKKGLAIANNDIAHRKSN